MHQGFKVVYENGRRILREEGSDWCGYSVPKDQDDEALCILASNLFQDGYQRRKDDVGKAMKVITGADPQ
jgi:hypothetical protein